MENNPFSPTSGAGSAPDLIPNGTLSWAMLSVQSKRNSKESNGEYYSVELTLIGGEFEGRKVFDIIPNIYDQNNSEKWRTSGIGAITRIFESSGWFKPAEPASYNAFAGKPFEQIMAGMDGQRVAIKVKVEKSKDPAYADKNKVAEWLSPNPASRSGYADYQRLIGGQGAVQQARVGAFAPAATPAPGAGAPGWIKSPNPNAPF
jgi:hypothetical protein